MSFRSRAMIAILAAGALAGLAFSITTFRKAPVTVNDKAQEAPTLRGAEVTPLIRMDDERLKLAKIELAKVEPGMIARRLIVPGTVVPDAGRVSHVSVKLSGSVAELRKNIGDDVTKGEILGALESREVADAKSEYMAAKLSNELQQDLTARDKAVWEGRAAPEQQYIRSRNAAAQSAMRFDIARQKLLALGIEDNEITAIPQAPESTLRVQNVRAPISGRIAERKVEQGTAVGRDSLETELFVIVDLTRVWVEMTVSPTDLPLVQEGQTVDIKVRNGGPSAIGKIIFVSPLLDKDTRTARVVAALENPDKSWRPGSFVTAAISVNERRAPAVVPIGALQAVSGQKTVFVRTAEGFEPRRVVVGQRDGGIVEIREGLQAGEEVAATNTFSLKAELSKSSDED